MRLVFLGQFGHLEVIVKKARLGSAVPAVREMPEESRRVVDANLMGAYWMARPSRPDTSSLR